MIIGFSDIQMFELQEKEILMCCSNFQEQINVHIVEFFKMDLFNFVKLFEGQRKRGNRGKQRVLPCWLTCHMPMICWEIPE